MLTRTLIYSFARLFSQLEAGRISQEEYDRRTGVEARRMRDFELDYEAAKEMEEAELAEAREARLARDEAISEGKAEVARLKKQLRDVNKEWKDDGVEWQARSLACGLRARPA